MLKKLFLVFFLVPAAAGAVVSAAVPTGRPSAMGRAPTMPGIGISAGIMTGGSIGGSGVANAGDSRCATPLPDETTTSRCIQKYMACLKQDIVCGEHFESCDTKKKFTQKRIFCDERLLECPDEGITGIYGVTVKSTKAYATCEDERTLVQRTFSPAINTLEFTNNSMLDTEITAGAAWVASNSATACASIVDGCIKRACQNSAFKCISIDRIDPTDADADGVPDAYATMASMITTTGGPTNVAPGSFRVSPIMVQQYVNNMVYEAGQSKAYLKNACETEIGSNKSCFILVNGNVPPDDSWTTDSFEIDLVYSQMVQNRMASNQNKILDWLAQDVGKSVDACKTAARTCVTSACGSGSIAACYGAALDNGTVTAAKLTQNIGNKCQGVVNAEQSCRDVFSSKDDPNSPLWDKLWGTQANNFNDPGSLGLAQQLASELAQMFSDNVVRGLFTQCRGEAESCVRRECGTGFKSCYINDIWLGADTQNTGYGAVGIDGYGSASATDNAAGGFDSTMAKSLCILPIKRSESCQKYFDIEYAKNLPAGGTYSFGGSWGNMNSAWNEAGSANWTSTSTTAGGQTVSSTQTCSALKNYFQDTSSTTCARNPNGTQVDPMCVETTTVNSSFGTSAASNAMCAAQEDSIFTELIADVAQTARAGLTREQNLMKSACETHRGGSSLNDTYIWAKKPAGGAPDNYSIAGLGEAAQKTGTADLWGAFCQVKVMMSSTDSFLVELMKSNEITSSVYFALGDAPICGGWLTESDMKKIETKIRDGIGVDQLDLNWAQRNKALVTTMSVLGGMGLGGAGGFFGGKALGGKIGSMQGETDEEEELNNAKKRINAFEAKVLQVENKFRQDVASQDSSGSGAKIRALTAGKYSISNAAKMGHTDADKTSGKCKSAADSANTAYRQLMGADSRYITGVGLDTVDVTRPDLCVSAIESAVDREIEELNSRLINEEANFRFNATNCGTKDGYRDDGVSGYTGALVLCDYEVAATGSKSAKDVEAEIDRLKTDINKIRTADTTETAKAKGENLGSMIGLGLGAALGGIGGGLAANSIIENSIEKAETDAEKAAIADWYKNVGSKIQCTVGGKVVGSYGDTIELK